MSKDLSNTEIMRALRSQASEIKLITKEPSLLSRVRAWFKRVDFSLLEAKLIEEQVELQKQSIRIAFHL